MQNITTLEKVFNVKFPNEFRERMDYISKKILCGIKLVFNNPMGPISIVKVLEFNSEKEESIFHVYTEFRDLMKEGIIPIANAGYDDYICLYFIDR